MVAAIAANLVRVVVTDVLEVEATLRQCRVRGVDGFRLPVAEKILARVRLDCDETSGVVRLKLCLQLFVKDSPPLPDDGGFSYRIPLGDVVLCALDTFFAEKAFRLLSHSPPSI